MPSTNLDSDRQKLHPKDWQILLKVARSSIKYGLTHSEVPHMSVDQYPERLQQKRASFVTLKESNVLRGCIGSLEAYQPLVQDVAEHAFAAAFRDPRFPQVNHLEEPVLHISISILSVPENLKFASEDDLLEQIEKDRDGLVLQYQHHKSTFLPAVWDQITSKREFLQRLKEKAGLDANIWDDEMKISRYFTETID